VARKEVAFVNASPLVGLAHSDGLAWLRKLFGRALITPTVRSEVLTGLGRPGEAEVSAAIRRRQISVLRRDPAGPLLPALDDGEASTIRAALAHGQSGFHLSPDPVAAILRGTRGGLTPRTLRQTTAHSMRSKRLSRSNGWMAVCRRDEKVGTLVVAGT
jgi:hypothetical protein